MKNYYIEKYKVKDTDVDLNLKLPVTQIIRLLQDLTFTHSDNLGLDHTSMINHSKAFWVITKFKLKILEEISQFDALKLKTWTLEPTGVRVYRNFAIEKAGKTVVVGMAEWCCLDIETRKIRKMSTIKYPNLKMKEKLEVDINYCNLKVDITPADLVYSRKILSTDIDVNKHTNNLRYNYFALDALSLEELENLKIKEYEVHFVNESKFGETIDIYKKDIEDKIYIEGKTNEKTVFRSIILR